MQRILPRIACGPAAPRRGQIAQFRALLLCFLSLSCSGGVSKSAQQAAGEGPQLEPLLAADVTQFPELEATVACSEMRLRDPLALITWGGSVELTRQQLRIDATVHPDGFERGYFVTALVAPGAAFSPSVSALKASPPKRPFQIRIANAEDARVAILIRPPTRTIVVEQLEPGVNYFFRVARRTERGWAPGPVVQVQAPTCPADNPARR